MSIKSIEAGLGNAILKDQEFERFGVSALDERSRITISVAIKELKERFKQEPTHFSIYINKAGQILLSPETTIPLDEAWLFKNPKAMDSVLRGMTQAKEGKLRKLESFAKHADDEIE